MRTLLIALSTVMAMLLASCSGSENSVSVSNQTSSSQSSTAVSLDLSQHESTNQEVSTSAEVVPSTELSTTSLEATTILPTTEDQQVLSATRQVISISFQSEIQDVSSAELQSIALATLNDPRGWTKANFEFVASNDAANKVILAEGPKVDQLCLPLKTYSSVSCQNGTTVALNADRWRSGVDHWDGPIETYREYLVNHEVGHLIGMRHPKPRCPVAGRPAGVMEQQTKSLEGCTGNGWPRDWEIEYAKVRPIKLAPTPDWGPDPVPTNSEK